MTRYSDPRKLVRNGVESEFYYVRVREQGGRRTWKSTGAKTIRNAEAVIRKWEAREARGDLAVTENVATDAAAESWLALKELTVSHTCLSVYRVYVRSWQAAFKAKRLRALEEEEISAVTSPIEPGEKKPLGPVAQYFSRRKAEGLSERSLNDELYCARAFFTWAIDRGYMSRNPAKWIPKFHQAERTIRVLEAEEEARLLKESRKVGERFYGSILCLMRSGLRRGTVARLEYSDIDWDNREWKIPAAKMKSKVDFLQRPIAPDLFAWFKEHARTAGRIFGPFSIKKWKLAVSSAGLSNIRPHDVRRGFVTMCRRANIPMEVCMYLSDHRDIATVIKVYRAVDPRDAWKAMNALFGTEMKAAAVGGGA
jgi:integrase